MSYQRGIVHRREFPPGYPTTVGTLQWMAELVRNQHLDPRIRNRALGIFARAGVASHDYDGQIGAIWDFILQRVRYVRDPLGAEHLTEPVELDHRIDEGTAAEDCESLATYAATLFASVGIVSEFEAQAKNAAKPDTFTHCSLQVQHPETKRWISFDLVGASRFPETFGLGDTLHRANERVELWTLDGNRREAMSYFDDGMGNTTQQPSPPWAQAAGGIVGGLVSVAGGLVSAITGQPVGNLLPGGAQAVGGGPNVTVGVEHTLSTPALSPEMKNILIWGAVIGGGLLAARALTR